MADVLHAPRLGADVPTDAADERGYYSISQAAALLGVSRVSIWRWIGAGLLPALRLGHRTIRIKRDDLERALVQMGSTGTRSWVVENLEAGVSAEDSAPCVDWREIGPSEHLVQFYETDAFLLEGVSYFIGSALRAGDAAIIVATEAHRAGIEERLQTDGLDLAAARARGRYVALDAAETLSRCMVDDLLNPGRFAEVVGDIIVRATSDGCRVRIFGEMVALLAVEGNDAAIRLEELWNDLQQTHAFALLCAYPLDRLGGEAFAQLLGNVCAEHSRVVPAESYTALIKPDDRLRAIAMLQHKAHSLEAELAGRKRAEQELRRTEAELQELLRTRDKFLASAAHDLKNPLANIKGQAQLMRRRAARAERLDAAQVMQVLANIDASATRMVAMVDELLDSARLQLGQPLELNRRRTDLVALAHRITAEHQSTTERHRLRVEAAATELVGVWDGERLERVLGNLLGNAVKYSPHGGEILISVAREDGLEGVWAVVAVRDEGVGIPAADLPRVFQRFHRGANVVGRIGGTGIGLAGARAIVESHGGMIAVESQEGAGSTFTVRLPLETEESDVADPRD